MAKYAYEDNPQLSPHFCAREFRCKCSSPHTFQVSEQLISMLERLYMALDCGKIIVSSGYRCAAHDKAVGGNGAGQHTKGTAADVVCYDKSGNIISAKTVCCKAQDLGFGGIANITGAYTSVHLDVRTGSRYYGDETKGTNTVTNNFYSYFGIAKAQPQPSEIVAKGIDVSKHQGVINWEKVKASRQVDFAILRAGFGKESSQIDVQFERNYSECKRLGIPCGAYCTATPKLPQKRSRRLLCACLLWLENSSSIPLHLTSKKRQVCKMQMPCVRRFAVRWNLPGIMRQFIRSSRLWKAVSGTI